MNTTPTDAPEGTDTFSGQGVSLPDVERFWPAPRANAPRPVLAAAALTGLLGAFCVFPAPHPGLGLVLVGLGATLTAALALPARSGTAREAGPTAGLTPWLAGYGGLALALLAVVAVRGADWLTALCLLGGFGVASMALAGGPGWTSTLLSAVTVPLAGLRMPPWAMTSLAERWSARIWSVLRGATVGVLLLVVFGALFASADAAFAGLVDRLVPDVSLRSIPQRVVAFCGAAGLALAAAYVVLAPPRWERVAPGPATARARWEWLVPVAALDALFAVFAAVQLTVLFGGHAKVLEDTGTTYADYARAGFAQLVVATALTLAVVAWAARRAPRARARESRVSYGLLALLCALTLVVVASALRRLGLYEQAYGWTSARLLATAVELWLGLVVLMVFAALGRAASTGDRGRWVPPAVAASAAVALLVLALVNPDAYVAQRNAERLARGGGIDATYLATLSADAVPTLERLPEPFRSCALGRLTAELREPDPWYGANLARARARALLERRPPVAVVAETQRCSTGRDEP